jgi:precorrin-6A/cobalt-precorrin-6A reductase
MERKKRLLILGGSTDAAELAARAATIANLEVITSLAGRTRAPIIRSTNTRIGGFGGISGLIEYIQQEQIDLIIDATHPFAEQISANALAAATTVGIPMVKLLRPAWDKIEGDRWIEVENNETAAKILPDLAQRVFLTIGRQELSTYAGIPNIWFLMRAIDPPDENTPIPAGKLLTQRGPFSLEEERALLEEYRIEAIVSKNSGGSATYAKIVAARAMGIPIVMVQRPFVPRDSFVVNVELALGWLMDKC